ncbi:MAG: helicase C-terminal domain-containing protein [Candidatus Nitrosopolaris sp.]
MGKFIPRLISILAPPTKKKERHDFSSKAKRAKRKAYEQWYNWQTALRLVQGYGRSIRSKEDWAKTYVLDSAFGPFVKKNTNILPNWFTQAIQA